MSLFDKKFQELLEKSPEHVALKQRVDALETQVAHMSKALGQVMKAYSDLAKITIDNRKSLEEVLAYLTDPLETSTGDDDVDDESKPSMSPEELAAYKRSLN